jgi:hypothetical protein
LVFELVVDERIFVLEPYTIENHPLDKTENILHQMMGYDLPAAMLQVSEHASKRFDTACMPFFLLISRVFYRGNLKTKRPTIFDYRYEESKTPLRESRA